MRSKQRTHQGNAHRCFTFQTSHVLTWAAINPVAALSYFASARLNQVANSYTIQFASRMLYTTKSEALILYIPQLVQAVRYDEVLGKDKIHFFPTDGVLCLVDGFCTATDIGSFKEIESVGSSTDMEYSH
jgi:hypothetical protein